jgi:hypothetical protein
MWLTSKSRRPGRNEEGLYESSPKSQSQEMARRSLLYSPWSISGESYPIGAGGGSLMVRPKKVRDSNWRKKKPGEPTASEQRKWARRRETLEKFEKMRLQ